MTSTAVERVALNFGEPEQRPIDRIAVAEAKAGMDEGHFAPGSMRPRIQASLWFIENGGTETIITDPENIQRALAGEVGTQIVP
jgi:carbamate kinase